MVYDERRHQDQLKTMWISQASATQRGGRTARVRPGTVWRLYPKTEIFEKMRMYDPPEMEQSPVDSVLLGLMVSGGDTPATDILSRVMVSLHKSLCFCLCYVSAP
jgi:HrpA-like RNA helicase